MLNRLREYEEGYIFDKWSETLDKVSEFACLSDEEAYPKYPEYRWMFNKLHIAEAQGIEAFPHGIEPKEFPIISRPIVNIQGLGTGARQLTDWHDDYYEPGYFWQAWKTGSHMSTDFAVIKGVVQWRHTMLAIKPVTFTTPHKLDSIQYWVQCSITDDEAYKFTKWIAEHFANYTGIVCIEHIDDLIIECVPRLSAQWVDLQGKGYLNAVRQLYETGTWFDPGHAAGVSWVKRTWIGKVAHDHSLPYVANEELLYELAESVSGLYLPWYKDTEMYLSTPDENGNYRLAVINDVDINKIKQVDKALDRVIAFERRKLR